MIADRLADLSERQPVVADHIGPCSEMVLLDAKPMSGPFHAPS